MPKHTICSIFLAACFLVISPAAPATTLHHTYATCYDLQGRTASGWFVDRRTAAHNYLRLGTRIRLVNRPFLGGIRRFRIHDTGPALADGHLDLWAPWGCAGWGVRRVTYKLGWHAP